MLTHHRFLNPRRLLEPRAVIAGIALLHLVITSVWVSRWYEAFGKGPTDVYPDHLLVLPLILLLAAVMLLIRKWWSHLLALVASGWVIYFVGFLGFSSIARAHDQPLFSLWVARVWFIQKSAVQSQELLQLSLASVVLLFALAGLYRNLVVDPG